MSFSQNPIWTLKSESLFNRYLISLSLESESSTVNYSICVLVKCDGLDGKVVDSGMRGPGCKNPAKQAKRKHSLLF